MSQDIVREITFFLHSFLLGIGITFAYDFLLVARKVVPHGKLWTSLEDLWFWIFCGLGVFYMLYRENNGILRWFAVAGAIMGMFFYKGIMKNHFVNIMSTGIHKIMWLVSRLIQIVLKPMKSLFSALRRCVRFFLKRLKRVNLFIKKKLTVCIKMLKMVLCKR